MEDRMKKIGMMVLVVAGFAAGIAFVYSCGGGRAASAATTMYLNIAPPDFIGSVYTNQVYVDDYRVDVTTSNGVYYAAVHLPHGAEISSLKMYFTDELRGTPPFVTLSLLATDKDSVATGVQREVLAVLDSSGPLSPETTNVSTDLPAGTLVDNATYSYVLKLELPGDAKILHFAEIEYRVG